MKALVYTGPQTQSYQDTADPVPSPAESLIQVAQSGICGSDMHAFLGHDERRPAPLILGHEVSGTALSGAFSGQRVTVNPLASCGTCEFCLSGRDNLCPERKIISMPPREGGFAEFVTAADGNLVAVPDHVSDEQAALTEPLACGWHAVRLAIKALFKGPADAKALVIGGGTIGLGAALCLRAQGVSQIRIVEPHETRARYLRTRCSQEVLTPQESEASGLYDLVIDAVGFETTRAAASARIKPGGVIAHIGLGSAEGGLDIRRMTLQEITFIGTYTYTAQDFRDTARAMFEGHLGPLDWVEVRPLSEGLKAFTDLRDGKVAIPKILLKPNP